MLDFKRSFGISCAIASLPDNLLPALARHLSQKEILLLTLASRDLCRRVSALLSDERTSVALGFERRLHIPTTLDGALHDFRDRIKRLSRRFTSWTVCLVVREERGLGYIYCSGMPVNGPNCVFASVAASTFDIELATQGTPKTGCRGRFMYYKASTPCIDLYGVQLVGSVLRGQHLWLKRFRGSLH